MYRYSIRGRVSLARIYRYSLIELFRVQLAQRYRYSIIGRVSAQRTYSYGILVRLQSSQIYLYNILTRLTTNKRYRYSIRARVAKPQIYKYNILHRVTTSKFYRYRIRGLASLSQKYVYSIIGRLSRPQTYRYAIETVSWIITGKPSDFTQKLEDMIKQFITDNWSISNPAIGLSPRIITSTIPPRQAQVDNFAYDSFRSYYMRVKEIASTVTTRQIRQNVYEFETPIEIQCYSRRLTKGEAFSELNNMINELLRIFGTYQKPQLFGIEGVTFDKISNMDRERVLARTLWSRKLTIILHYYKASVRGLG